MKSAELEDLLARARQRSLLDYGCLIGHTTHCSTRLWACVARPGRWTLVWSAQAFDSHLQTVAAQCRIPHDFQQDSGCTHTFEIGGLQPDTCYFYALLPQQATDGAQVLAPEAGLHFRTLPAGPAALSFGFYSCHDPVSAEGREGAWACFAQRLQWHAARFVIGGGDQVYVDSHETGIRRITRQRGRVTRTRKEFPSIWDWASHAVQQTPQLLQAPSAALQARLLDCYRWYYRLYWKTPTLRSIQAQYPQYMIWDDHEIMDGWGSYTRTSRLNMMRREWPVEPAPDGAQLQVLADSLFTAAATAYDQFCHAHNPPTPAGQRDYGFEQCGVPFYLLDSRSWHDTEAPGPARILGEAQLQRFSQWLEQAATGHAGGVLVVVITVPLLHWHGLPLKLASLPGEARDDALDQWAHPHNHAERNLLLERMFAVAARHGITLLVLSGDVHCSGIYRLRHARHPGAIIYQITSSGISRPPAGTPLIPPNLVLQGDGPLDGHPDIRHERLHGQLCHHNFAIVQISQAPLQIRVEIGETDQTRALPPRTFNLLTTRAGSHA